MKAYRIAIDGSRAFLRQRTGIEEYSYQVIRHLREFLHDEEVTVYVRHGQSPDFAIPGNWRIKELWAPRLWTQGRLSWQMLVDRPDTLFVPAHTVPIVHPGRTVVVVHGLEYEFLPQAYSWWERLYMRWSIRYSVRAASGVICVSENTRRDVARLYGVPEGKMTVIYEGYDDSKLKVQGSKPETVTGDLKSGVPYFLFVGRIEERKNVGRIIRAFGMFKERTGMAHRLVLAGRPGYGYGDIISQVRDSRCKGDIVESGYVSDGEKWRLLAEAEAFVFPTLYEGFGIPILEAQSVGAPVIASDNSSVPEVAGDAAILVDPYDEQAISLAMERVCSDRTFRDGIIRRGHGNVRRFGWKRCAQEISEMLRYERTPEHRDEEGEAGGDRP